MLNLKTRNFILLSSILLISVLNYSGNGFTTDRDNLNNNITDQIIDAIEVIQPPDIKMESDISINIVFLGTNQSLINEQKIDNNITKYYIPTIAKKEFLDYNIKYNLDLNYHYSTQQFETDFVTYLDSMATQDDPPSSLINNYDLNPTFAWYINAENTLTWLDNNVNNYLGAGTNDTYTLYIIDTYSKNYVSDYYFYWTDVVDQDTLLPSPYNETNFFGGDYPSRGVFLDLSAGPVYYQENYPGFHNDDDGVSDDTIIPIWEYNFPIAIDFFSDQVAEYIQETIDLVFVPSYLYYPEIRTNFDVDIFLFDDASTSRVGDINMPIIEGVFENLLPYFNVDVDLTVTTISNYPSLADTVSNNENLEEGVLIVDPEPVKNFLMNNQNLFGVNDNTFPIYIFSWDDYKFFEAENVLGMALDDGNGNPELIQLGFPPTSPNNKGITSTVIHELGHLISLRHPHDGISYDRFNDTGQTNPSITDWLFDFISTPMTYANPDVTFSTFDIDQLDRGYALNLVNSTWYNLYVANQTLAAKDYTNLSDTTTVVQDHLVSVLSSLDLVQNNFDNLDFYSAYYSADSAYQSSIDYLNAVSNLPQYEEPDTDTEDPNENSSTIPTGNQSSDQDTNTDEIGLNVYIMIPLFTTLVIMTYSRKFRNN